MNDAWTEEPLKVWGQDAPGRQWRLPLDYNLADEKGRAVGGTGFIRRLDAGGALTTDGKPYEAWIQATRNGDKYGASPRSFVFGTLEEAKEYGVKALARQRKAYERKYSHGRKIFGSIG